MYLAIHNSLPVAQHATFPRLSTFKFNYFLLVLDHSQNEDFHHLTGGGGYCRRYQPATIAPGIKAKRSGLVDALLAIPQARPRQLSTDLRQSASRRNQ